MNIKDKKIIVGVILLILLVIIFVFIFSRRKTGNVKDSLYLEGDGKKLSLQTDGSGTYEKNGSVFSLSFDQSQYGDIINYLKRNGVEGSVDDAGNYFIVRVYENGQETIYYIPKDDNFIDSLDDYISGGGGSSGGTSGGSDDQDEGDSVFDFSTPTPFVPSATSRVSPTSTPPGDCPMWLLSYCLYPKSPRPSPSSTPTPNPEVVEDCSFWSRFINVRAVVSNTFCVSSSPTPTP